LFSSDDEKWGISVVKTSVVKKFKLEPVSKNETPAVKEGFDEV